MSSLLSARGAAFGYDRRPVVRGVDLEIHAGELLGLAGSNGAGKTTLVRGLLGLLPALEGEVTRTQRVGYVPQRETLDELFPLTVGEVVEMGAYAQLRGLRRVGQAARRRVAQCLERVQLEARVRERFASLSGGQRQRALIARALVAEPELLLLDEPTSGVDVESAGRIGALLAELARESSLAVLVVSHSRELLRDVTQAVLWVEDGRVERRDPQRALERRAVE